MKGNRFSELLNRLVGITGIKNYTIANYLQYDVSYISKWMNGKNLPSEKSFDMTAVKIAECLINNSSDEGIRTMMEDYSVNSTIELKQAVILHLKNEFDYVREMRKTDVTENLSRVEYYPSMPFMSIVGKICYPLLKNQSRRRIIACVDFMSISDEYRQKLLNSNMGRENVKNSLENMEFSLLMHFQSKDNLQGVLFLTDVFSKYSNVNFSLYNTERARGSIAFIVDEAYSIVGTIKDGFECISVTVCEDPDYSRELYDKFNSYCLQSDRIFRRYVGENEYDKQYAIEFLLSNSKSLLIHKPLEAMIPDSVIQDVDPEFFEMNKDTLSMIRTFVKKSSFSIVMPKNIFLNFILDGNATVCGKQISLEKEHKLASLKYTREVICENKELDIHIYDLDDAMLADADIYISDSLQIVSVDRADREKAIIMIEDVEIKKMYKGYMDEILSRCSGREEALNLLERAIDSLEIVLYQDEIDYR